MTPELPAEAQQLATAARRAFDSLGGVAFARRAEAEPELRSEVDRVIVNLGAGEMDPLGDVVALGAAAALCVEAGRVALPYPVAAAVLRDPDGYPIAAVASGSTWVDHGDLFGHWHVGTLEGTGGVAVPAGRPPTGRLGPFVTGMQIRPGTAAADGVGVLCHVVLTAWTVLGTVERALDSAVEHVSGREQFGRPLSAFQAVQFQLADASVAAAGLRELAGFTLWRLHERREGARADVLALRLHTQQVARSVLRAAQQLHGAAGVCDEYDVSVLTRLVQPHLRLTAGVHRSAADLADAIAQHGFEGLFPHGADLRSAAGVGAR